MKRQILSITCAMLGLTVLSSELEKIDIDLYSPCAPGSAELVRRDLPFEYYKPRVTVFLPPKEKRNGAMVLLVPGGGYMYCSYAWGEGFWTTDYFTRRGISAAVVQYRRNMFQEKDGSLTCIYKDNVALADSEQAMRILRAHAGEWSIDAAKIGAVGFSAGAHIVGCMAVHPRKGETTAKGLLRFGTRPDFMVLAYPLVSMDPPYSGECWRDNLMGKHPAKETASYYSVQKHVTCNTPPTFIAVAQDDFTVRDAQLLDRTLTEKGVPHEFHLLPKGGHGFGLEPVNQKNAASVAWPKLLEQYLRKIGIFTN